MVCLVGHCFGAQASSQSNGNKLSFRRSVQNKIEIHINWCCQDLQGGRNGYSWLILCSRLCLWSKLPSARCTSKNQLLQQTLKSTHPLNLASWFAIRNLSCLKAAQKGNQIRVGCSVCVCVFCVDAKLIYFLGTIDCSTQYVFLELSPIVCHRFL